MLRRCGARLVLMLKGVAQAEETNHTEVHSTSKAIQVPSVITASKLPAHSPAEQGAFPEEHFAARPQYLPVLRRGLSGVRVDARSRDAAVPGRPVLLGESGGLLLHLQ